MLYYCHREVSILRLCTRGSRVLRQQSCLPPQTGINITQSIRLTLNDTFIPLYTCRRIIRVLLMMLLKVYILQTWWPISALCVCMFAALELKEDYLKAYMRRAQAQEALEKYEDALEGAFQTDTSV